MTRTEFDEMFDEQFNAFKEQFKEQMIAKLDIKFDEEVQETVDDTPRICIGKKVQTTTELFSNKQFGTRYRAGEIGYIKHLHYMNKQDEYNGEDPSAVDLEMKITGEIIQFIPFGLIKLV